MIREQAEYLATVTELTAKQAEAYLHWYVSEDDVSQRELADEMGIDKSTFSQHLTAAKGVIDYHFDEDGDVGSLIESNSNINSLIRAFILSDIGDGGLLTKSLVEIGKSENYRFMLFQEISGRQSPWGEYKFILMEEHADIDIDYGDIPDGVTLASLTNIYSVDASSDESLVETVDWYLGQLDVDKMDEFIIKNSIEDALSVDFRSPSAEEALKSM